ncbi:MAG TPA: hypothetical protein VNY78_06370 [Edaphobacter sp.]|nr:hypothetical protein [Edaphobacter sp.]
MPAKRFMALLLVSLIAAELHTGATFSFCTSKAGAFQIVGAVLDM